MQRSLPNCWRLLSCLKGRERSLLLKAVNCFWVHRAKCFRLVHISTAQWEILWNIVLCRQSQDKLTTMLIKDCLQIFATSVGRNYDVCLVFSQQCLPFVKENNIRRFCSTTLTLFFKRPYKRKFPVGLKIGALFCLA